MKKILCSILLISVLTLTAFAVTGCGDDEEEAKESGNQTSSSQNSGDTVSGSQATDGIQAPETPISPEVSVSSGDPSTYVANEDAEKAVSTVLDYIKNGKYEKAQALILPKQRFETEPDLGFDATTMKKVEKILSKVEYTVINSNTTGETTAIVNVKIKAADFKKIFTEYMKNAEEAQSKGFKNEKEQESFTDDAFQKSLKDNGTKLITKQVTVQLVKKDNIWKIQDTVEFSEAILGGIPAVSHAFFDIQ